MNQDQEIVDKFSTHLKNVLTRALCLAVETHEKIIRPEHLLWALGTQKGCIGAEVLKKAGIKQTDFKKLASIKSNTATDLEADNLKLHLSENAKRIVEKAVLTANGYGHRYIGTEHLLSFILQIEDVETHMFFTQMKTNTKELQSQLSIVLKSASKFPDFAHSVSGESQTTSSQTQTNEHIPETEKKKSALD